VFDFVAIDFETATNYIPCSLGIAVVKQSQIVEVRNWLIKPICFPYFHFYAQKIHGIHKEDVENEPTFDLLWNEIEPYLQNTIIVAHNANFDVNVLRKTLFHYHIPKPKSRYLCTYVLARFVWKESKKFSLDFLSNQEHIELNHHHSDSDAEACARLLLKEAEHLNCNDFNELKKVTKIRYCKV
jgi:DNA polymerase-3 subunit epsilon